MGRVAEAVWVVVEEVDTEVEMVYVAMPEVAWGVELMDAPRLWVAPKLWVARRGDGLPVATSVVARGLGDADKLSKGAAVVATWEALIVMVGAAVVTAGLGEEAPELVSVATAVEAKGEGDPE